jgi:hypothetical protein
MQANFNAYKEAFMKYLLSIFSSLIFVLAVSCGNVPSSSDSNIRGDLISSSPDKTQLQIMGAGNGDVGGRYYYAASPVNDALVKSSTKITLYFDSEEYFEYKDIVTNSTRISAVYQKNGQNITKVVESSLKWSDNEHILVITPHGMPHNANVIWQVGTCDPEHYRTE